MVATGIKEGFLQFIDALPMSNILANSEYRTIKEYLRKNNPSESERHGISAEAMDNYVRSCGNIYTIMLIYPNILINGFDIQYSRKIINFIIILFYFQRLF